MTELLKVFTNIVADQHVSRLIPLMVTAQSKPFCIPPAIMSTMCKHLYQLNPDYTVIEPKLLAKALQRAERKGKELAFAQGEDRKNQDRMSELAAKLQGK